MTLKAAGELGASNVDVKKNRGEWQHPPHEAEDLKRGPILGGRSHATGGKAKYIQKTVSGEEADEKILNWNKMIMRL
jgi:hypothetical protein